MGRPVFLARAKFFDGAITVARLGNGFFGGGVCKAQTPKASQGSRPRFCLAAGFERQFSGFVVSFTMRGHTCAEVQTRAECQKQFASLALEWILTCSMYLLGLACNSLDSIHLGNLPFSLARCLISRQNQWSQRTDGVFGGIF